MATSIDWLFRVADPHSAFGWNGPLMRDHRTLGDVAWAYGAAGAGPTALLLHGTGSALHTWRDLGPLLAQHYRVLAVDLPGHGNSTYRNADALTLVGMARRLAALLNHLSVEPRLIVGHSAGAALAVQLCLADGVAAERIVSLAGAFLPYGGPAQSLLGPLAGFMATSTTVTRYIAAQASDLDRVDRLIRSTGSRLDDQGLRAYQATLSSAERVRATLTMMARWRIEPLFDALPRLKVPLHLVVGRRDAAVAPWQADRVLRRCAVARKTELADVGHLMHEEAPERIAALICDDSIPPSSATDAQ